jgi:uncharacterized cupredoxin-like copper-binding protein
MKKRIVRASIAIVVVAVAVPAAVLAAQGNHKAQTVSVTLNEFHIKGVPKKLKPGSTTFQVKNAGKFPHDFVAMFAPAGSKFRTAQLKPGAGKSVTANLKPGAYIVICDVGAGYHASQGMIAKFTVGKFDFTTFKWTA